MPTKAQLMEDIDFLVQRASRAGRFEVAWNRDWGVSSNALVRLAYGGASPGKDERPFDKDDLGACYRVVNNLPRHRHTPKVLAALREIEQEFFVQEINRRSK